MTDRELLEMAAKAAGRLGHWDGDVFVLDDYGQNECSAWWPLDNDGDALRLAVKLGLVLNLSPREDCRGQTVVTFNGLSKIGEPCYEGREQAARRAIVRAAAEIGKGMP